MRSCRRRGRAKGKVGERERKVAKEREEKEAKAKNGAEKEKEERVRAGARAIGGLETPVPGVRPPSVVARAAMGGAGLSLSAERHREDRSEVLGNRPREKNPVVVKGGKRVEDGRAATAAGRSQEEPPQPRPGMIGERRATMAGAKEEGEEKDSHGEEPGGRKEDGERAKKPGKKEKGPEAGKGARGPGEGPKRNMRKKSSPGLEEPDGPRKRKEDEVRAQGRKGGKL